MKISDVRAVPSSIPMRPVRPASPWAAWSGKQVIVRVLTDEGPEGVGRRSRSAKRSR